MKSPRSQIQERAEGFGGPALAHAWMNLEREWEGEGNEVQYADGRDSECVQPVQSLQKKSGLVALDVYSLKERFWPGRLEGKASGES